MKFKSLFLSEFKFEIVFFSELIFESVFLSELKVVLNSGSLYP
jgi:hypothetical protein